ncbi:hypothetical protein QBC33DRAFT_591730 [Phialemonium atrogriseum]|uniref:Uncharacterized protein n=1 Tax=Phialemonium atrogriseum TaxID=1093897 RepID=A0AAJ0C7N1_9PEZI|nr:uncharacterized protein QBC33DRAFT_591730 [Phialemonium atrogriseum]KAK1771445.1 hypothetical protein QBC33DRAFT_591730 [Phialemonium atrogriseum]
MTITRNIPLPSPRTAGTILAVLLTPVLLETGYLLYLKRTVTRRTVASAGRRLPAAAAAAAAGKPTADENSKARETIPASVKRPTKLPAAVADDASQDYVLAYERLVSHPVAAASLRDGQQQQLLLTSYVRATMKAFARTPQSFAIRAAAGPDARRTFAPAYIDGLAFGPGDRVDGVYTVAYRGSGGPGGRGEERVELMLDAPEGYRGPVVTGMIVAAVEVVPGDAERPEQVVFVNETWMWRRLDERPTMLEGSLGSWLHSLLAGWLVVKGVEAVTK